MAYTDTQIHLFKLYHVDNLTDVHINYLKDIKTKYNFEPTVIYDIGACVLHWTKETRKIWPKSKIVLFDAIEEAEFLYAGYDYNINVLGDTDNKIVDFYQNNEYPSGNSYYKEIGSDWASELYNNSNKVQKIMKTLDTVVKERGFPLPELIKIDVQGCEVDILKGAKETLKSCKHLIVEFQHKQYNEGAPLADESIAFVVSLGFKLITPLFCNNGPDGDYHFIKE